MGDVVAGVALGAPLRPRRAGARRAARSRLQRRRGPGRQLGGQHGQEAAEVLGVPGAGQVGLAEADQPVAAEPGEELVGPVHGHRRAALAEGVRPLDGGRSTGGHARRLRRRGTAGARPRPRRRRGARSGPSPGPGHGRVAGRVEGRVVIADAFLVVRAGRGAAGPAAGGPTARCRGRGSGATRAGRPARRRQRPRPSVRRPARDALKTAPSSVRSVTATCSRSPGTGTARS